MNIPSDLLDLINKKKLKKFSNAYLLQIIIELLSSRNQTSRRMLSELDKTLQSIDTQFAIDFMKIAKSSFLYPSSNTTSFNSNERATDWIEEDLIDYRSDKFIRQKNVQKIINNVMKEHQKIEVLKEHDLEPISKLLFDGKSGVGKTECAKEIAFKMDLPLYTLDLATIFDSHLGATGAKLKKVVEFATSHECVFLLDEFDSIASARNTNKNDVGETKRIVNVLLKLIESWNPKSILICATNHIEAIDTAMLRRFDEHIKFKLPDNNEIIQIIDYRFKKFSLSDISKSLLVKSFSGKSHGIIINECNSIVKVSILDELCINKAIRDCFCNNEKEIA